MLDLFHVGRIIRNLCSHHPERGAEQEARHVTEGFRHVANERNVKGLVSVSMSWEEILLPVGYRSGPRRVQVSNVHAPGGSHEKSVTCHVPGCDNDKYNHDDPPHTSGRRIQNRPFVK